MTDYDAAPRDTARLYQVASLDAPLDGLIERRRAHGEPASPERNALEMEQASSMETVSQARQFAAAFDALSDSVLIVDRQGRILQANAADRAMFGYGAQSPDFTSSLGRRARLLLALDERGQPLTPDQAPFARILRGEMFSGRHAVDATLHSPTGRVIQVSVSNAPLFDAAGRLIGSVVTTRDVTEQRRRERTLRDTNRSLQELLAVAAHDLRTPITASKGYIQLAIRRLSKLAATARVAPAMAGEIERLRRNLNDAEHSAQRLARLVERLLDVAHIQGDKLQVKPEVVDLAAVIRASVREQRLATPARVIRYTVRPLRAVPILADADRIGQVLLNYLANALKFSPEDTIVEITLAVGDGQARVSVRDHGLGIPMADQERIWRRFEQLEERRRAGAAPGLGLGLYISRAIVEAHGGRVGVENAADGGSIFWFETPLARHTP